MTSQNQNSDQMRNGTYIGEEKELSFLVGYKECSFFVLFLIQLDYLLILEKRMTKLEKNNLRIIFLMI